MRKDRMQWKIPKIELDDLKIVADVIAIICIIILGLALLALVIFGYYSIWAFLDIKECNALLEIFIKLVLSAVLTLFILSMFMDDL